MKISKAFALFLRCNLIAFPLIVMSFIGIYAGHFLLREDNTEKAILKKSREENKRPLQILHTKTELKIGANRQAINMLDIDLSDTRIKVMPVLSRDSIFGFERLSSIAERTRAYAAINGGFFYEYGEPAGIVVIDGKAVTDSTGKYPVLIIENRQARLTELDTEFFLLFEGGEIRLNNINAPGGYGSIVAYTPYYGSSNREENENITAVIENNIVRDVSRKNGETLIPDDGMLLTMREPFAYETKDFPLKKGQSVELLYTPDLGRNAQAYECGSWIVKEGKNVIKPRDNWIGAITNRSPRTAVGIKENGDLVLLTVDGRQPGHSTGVTGKELGDLLLRYGIENAAMLDGGASTEMIIDGKIVNSPSDDGMERPLGGGIIVRIEE